MKLSILLPTYNRAPFLLKNLGILSDYIRKGNYQDQIEIIISNNNSPDDTDSQVQEFKKENQDIVLHYHIQNENIGLENNALFVLDKAIGKYIMYLGDDDYIEYKYLTTIIDHLNIEKNTSVIIPSYVNVDINEVSKNRGRDLELPTTFHKAGFKNCLINSFRGHQLSGLVLKREDLYDSYKRYAVKNIYLFIYFVAYQCLNGDTLHLTEYPVKVTEPGQENKNWGYGKDGLINEVFDNYKKLPVNTIKRTLLELNFYNNQPWRLWIYQKKSIKDFIMAFFSIWFSKNSSFLFKLIFPFEVFVLKIIKFK